MKIRKILPLVLLAVGSVFLLSGCDAILNAIFQNNQISVDVAVVSSVGVYNDYLGGFNPQVTCYVYDSSNNPVSLSGGWSSYDGYFVHFNFGFTKLKNDTYHFAAQYSGYNGGIRGSNGSVYDGNQPSTSFIALATSPFLTMPYDNPSDSTGHSMPVRLYIP
jgi:hypothetical protein